jgi:hypothetical protein
MKTNSINSANPKIRVLASTGQHRTMLSLIISCLHPQPDKKLEDQNRTKNITPPKKIFSLKAEIDYSNT